MPDRPTPEKLTQIIVTELRKPDVLESFLKECAIKQLKQTVENNWQTIADKKFTEDEIDEMKKIQLNKLKNIKHRKTYSDESGLKYFKINEIRFSDRRPTAARELRGVILRNALYDLSTKHPDMTLYDALNKLVREDPTMQVTYFLSSRAFHLKNKELSEFQSAKPYLTEALTRLSRACIIYAHKELSQEGSDKKIVDKLIANHITLNVIKSACDEKISDDNLYKILREQPIINALQKSIPLPKSKKIFWQKQRPPFLTKIDKELAKFHKTKNNIDTYNSALKIKKLIAQAYSHQKMTEEQIKELALINSKISPLIKSLEDLFALQNISLETKTDKPSGIRP